MLESSIVGRGILLPNKNETTSLMTNQNTKVKLIFVNDLKAFLKIPQLLQFWMNR